MKNLRNLMTGFVLAVVLMIGVGSANAGILMTDDFKETTSQPCTETGTKVDSGVIVTGITGVIVTGFTGVIVTGLTGVIVTGAIDTKTDCGVIVVD
jgi:hypothetical protein